MPTYVFLIFYKLKYLTPEEEEKARAQWEEIMESWPSKIRLVGVFDHAWGSSYNGFIILETDDVNTFVQFWKWFRDQIRWYVTATKTIIALKR